MESAERVGRRRGEGRERGGLQCHRRSQPIAIIAIVPTLSITTATINIYVPLHLATYSCILLQTPYHYLGPQTWDLGPPTSIPSPPPLPPPLPPLSPPPPPHAGRAQVHMELWKLALGAQVPRSRAAAVAAVATVCLLAAACWPLAAGGWLLLLWAADAGCLVLAAACCCLLLLIGC